MTVYELLFLALLLATLVLLVAAAALALLRRRPARLLLGLGIVWAVYLSIVFCVSAGTPQRTIAMGQDRCFDEMCFAVASVNTFSELGPAAHSVKAQGLFYVVSVRVTNRSRGRAQREAGLRGLLWSAEKYYEVSSEGQAAWEITNPQSGKLTARLNPGESSSSVLVFDVAGAPEVPGLVLSHGFTPGYFVIGECPLFHKPTIMRLIQ